MNYKMIGKIIGELMLMEAVMLLPPVLISALHAEAAALYGLGLTIGILLVSGGLLFLLCRKADRLFYARDGLVVTGLSWMVLAVFGALPFTLSRAIPDYIDALFEMVSGFTTTGSSIITDLTVIPKGLLWWRSFSHWIGGMGILVFLLAIVPLSGSNSGFTLHILRAESPGPSVGKLVPRMRKTASIMYLIYIGLTVINIVLLLLGGLPFFDACCIGFGTAGTGGFGIVAASCGDYSPYIQIVTTIFMLIFSINFSLYYFLLIKRFKAFFKDEELHLFVGIVIASIAAITINLGSTYSSLGETIRHAAFQVASIISTTGYATTDFNLWPSLSKGILLTLMLFGACAGSTGGGFKLSRVLILFKTMKRDFHNALHPDDITVVRINGHRVDDKVIRTTNSYLVIYCLIMIISFLLISLDGKSIETNISSVFATFNNIGPGLDETGPAASFASYSHLSKIVLTMDMLLGRLEITPVLCLFLPDTWQKH